MTVAVPALFQRGTARSRREPTWALGARARRVAVTALTLAASGVLFAAAGLLFFFHMSVQPVLTGSMRPAYGPGWAVVSRAIPVSGIRPGMIVIFVPPGHSAPFAHRVVSVAGSAEHPVLTTKGDANPSPDHWRARIDARSIQEVVWAVPWAGSAMVALHGEGPRIVAIVAVGLLVASVGARAIIGAPRHRWAASARPVS